MDTAFFEIKRGNKSAAIEVNVHNIVVDMFYAALNADFGKEIREFASINMISILQCAAEVRTLQGARPLPHFNGLAGHADRPHKILIGMIIFAWQSIFFERIARIVTLDCQAPCEGMQIADEIATGVPIPILKPDTELECCIRASNEFGF